MNEWIPVIVAFIAAAPGLMALYAQRKKRDREASLNGITIAKEYRDMARQQAKEITEMKKRHDKEIKGLETRVDELEQQVENLLDDAVKKERIDKQKDAGIALLTAQLEARDIPPGWKPEDITLADPRI